MRSTREFRTLVTDRLALTVFSSTCNASAPRCTTTPDRAMALSVPMSGRSGVLLVFCGDTTTSAVAV